MKKYTCLFAAVLISVLLAGCSDPSLKIALDAQRRADEVNEFIFERQHEGLVMYLYRDLANQLATEEGPLTAAQLATLNAGWNERDLIEHWAIQHERAKALRNVGVNTRLYSQQSVVDLIGKSFSQRAKVAQAALVEQAADKAIEEGVTEAQEELPDVE